MKAEQVGREQSVVAETLSGGITHGLNLGAGLRAREAHRLSGSIQAGVCRRQGGRVFQRHRDQRVEIEIPVPSPPIPGGPYAAARREIAQRRVGRQYHGLRLGRQTRTAGHACRRQYEHRTQSNHSAGSGT